MPYNFHGLKFWWLNHAPTTPGLYTVGKGSRVLYVGEAINRSNRIDDYGRGQHDGISRAIRMGVEWIHFSDDVWEQQDRWDLETLMRRELKPAANREAIPSASSCAEAARRLGLWKSALAYDRLAKPPQTLPPLQNAFSVTPLPAAPKVNAFAGLLLPKKY